MRFWVENSQTIYSRGTGGSLVTLPTVAALLYQLQCCGSGSGIGYHFDPWIRDGRMSASGSRIRDEQPGSYKLSMSMSMSIRYFLPWSQTLCQ